MTKAYDKLNGILMKKSVLKDIGKLSPDAQTSAFEGFYSMLNQVAPKKGYVFHGLGHIAGSC